MRTRSPAQPRRRRAVPGLRPDRRAFSPLRALDHVEASAWDRLAGPCCYQRSAGQIRGGVRAGADGFYHVEKCPRGQGELQPLLVALRGQAQAAGA